MLASLIELQRLKSLNRTGWALRGLPVDTESVGAHSFGVATTSMLLADRLAARDVEVDVARILRMALVHDWAEARIGDMPKTATGYFGQEVRRQAEMNAFKDLVQGTGAQQKIYRELFEEYELRSTLEAKLVKAADIIDLLVQVLALERAGYRGLDEFWEVAEAPNFQLEGEASEVVADVLQQLLAARSEIHNRN
jgi:putative hydrolase of HD superfamily